MSVGAVEKSKPVIVTEAGSGEAIKQVQEVTTANKQEVPNQKGIIANGATESDDWSETFVALRERVFRHKDKGNSNFAAGNWQLALSDYGLGISVCETEADSLSKSGERETLEGTLMPLILCNSALCHIKLENFGSAITDATRAIELSRNKSAKAFFRRGTAHGCLTNYEQAVKDFRCAFKLAPHDAAGAKRLSEAQKLLTQQRFADAIRGERAPPPSSQLDLNDFPIDTQTYKGPVYLGKESRTPEFFEEFVKYLNDHSNRLHRRVLINLALDIIESYKQEPNVIDIDLPDDAKDRITVCGDVHGQFYDLLSIFKQNGFPSETNRYLFNGDFVDRGSFSVEVITTLFLARLIWPTGLYMTRGNHESRRMTKLYGFEGEMKYKGSSLIYDLYCEAFEHLPLAHRINKKVFVVHGGLSSRRGVTLKEINEIDRFRDDDDDLMSDLLWADPQPELGSAPSKRGVSQTFGPDITEDFLKTNDLSLVIRSHEMKDNGYEIEHGGALVTIFSAPNYCDQMGNKGAFLILDGKWLNSDSKKIPDMTVFSHAEHPPVRAMQYGNPLFMS